MTDLKGSSEEEVAKETVKLAWENGISFLTVQMRILTGLRRNFSGKY